MPLKTKAVIYILKATQDWLTCSQYKQSVACAGTHPIVIEQNGHVILPRAAANKGREVSKGMNRKVMRSVGSENTLNGIGVVSEKKMTQGKELARKAEEEKVIVRNY